MLFVAVMITSVSQQVSSVTYNRDIFRHQNLIDIWFCVQKWKNTMDNPRPLRSIHQKKSIVEEIRTNPATYIGSVKPVEELQWVLDENNNQQMVQKKIVYGGLYKIFDEILMNAVAHKHHDKPMLEIRIDINAVKNEISVWNNGCGIPILMDETEKKWVPTMIFGNFDQPKIGGEKLCNMFCTNFKVETVTSKMISYATYSIWNFIHNKK